MDEQFSVVKEKKMDSPEKLDEFVWLPEEKQIIDLYSGEEILFLGQKNESYKNIKFVTDENVIVRIVKAAKHSFDKHFEISTKITKKQLSNSFTKEFLLIQTINSIDELDKSINLLSKRVREMYSAYSPEIERKLPDNDSFIRLVISKNRDDLLLELKLDGLMSCTIPANDVESIIALAKSVHDLIKEKERKENYLEELVITIAPNVVAMCGPKIASKMIAIAGSLRKLAFFPAGTVQTLGAEKALFEHLKNKVDPPKYGLLLSHPLVMAASIKDKGKTARKLANKILIAAKIDYFDKENNYAGYQLLEDLEKKINNPRYKTNNSNEKHSNDNILNK